MQRSLTDRDTGEEQNTPRPMQWAGHVERMADDRLPKRAAELREEEPREATTEIGGMC